MSFYYALPIDYYTLSLHDALPIWKVVDTNSPFLTRELRSLGVTVRRILTVPDELDEIAVAVAEFQERYDLVFTSGGDRKSTRLNSSHITISYAVFCLKKKNTHNML